MDERELDSVDQGQDDMDGATPRKDEPQERPEESVVEPLSQDQKMDEAVLKKALDIVSQAIERTTECQRVTADLLNRAFERHALYPAVRAVWALAEEISGLNRLAKETADRISGCPALRPLMEAAALASLVAEDKLACLDAKRICPCPGESFNPARHEPVGVVETEDESQRGRVAELVSPGLEYRGEVLRQARVKIFRAELQSRPLTVVKED